MGNNRLQTWFKQLILETRAYYPPALSKVYTKGKNLNRLSAR